MAEVIVETMSVLVEGRDPIVVNVANASVEKENVVRMKEGTEYQIQITFRVKGDIVSGLLYSHQVERKGLATDKRSDMMGSYGPKEESQSVTLKMDSAPRGMISRGRYEIDSKVRDSDHKTVWATWKWSMDVASDW